LQKITAILDLENDVYLVHIGRNVNKKGKDGPLDPALKGFERLFSSSKKACFHPQRKANQKNATNLTNFEF